MSTHDFCQAALADMAGPIPKVRLICELLGIDAMAYVRLSQDSYALILFAAICVFTSAFAAVYYLPAIAWFFAHISAESKS
jgi:inner membrane protein involved in colicin E2 resistance